MNHLTLRGSHREMGFQWGARLAERGLRLLDHVPFPLEAERRAFAAACHPAYARHFPAALEELEGLAAGQNCRQEDLETVLFTTYALPPACGCSCLAVSNGNGVFFGRNSDFLTALEPDYTHVTYGFSDRAIPFTGNTTSFVQMEDAVNARGLAIGLTSVYTPRPRPGLNAGMVLRLLAETCAAVPEALDRLRVLPLASCQTLTLADAAGDIAVAECSPEGMRVERPGPAGPFVCAANLFHSDLAVPLPPGLDSWRAAERYDTMRRVLEWEGETLALSDVQALLAGRKGFLCQYDRAGGGHPAADGGLRTVKQKNPQMGVLLSFCGIVKVCQQIPLGHLKDLTQAGQLIILDKPAVSLNFTDKRLVNVHAQQLQLGGQFLLGEPALLPKLSEAFGNEIGLGVVIGLVHVLHQHDIFS